MLTILVNCKVELIIKTIENKKQNRLAGRPKKSKQNSKITPKNKRVSNQFQQEMVVRNPFKRRDGCCVSNTLRVQWMLLKQKLDVVSGIIPKHR